jgi:peptide/nickel transport system permease protein
MAIEAALPIERAGWGTRAHSIWNSQWRGTILALGVVVVLALISFLVPVFDSDKPGTVVGRAFQSLSGAHPFGTDEYGRDLFIRVIDGMRVSMEIAVVTIVISGLVGSLVGLYAGYRSGWQDAVIMRIVDFLLGFPPLVLALVLSAIIGPSFLTPMFATTVISIPLFARMVRGSTLAERRKEYVTASRVSGASDLRIMLRTLVPSLRGIILVQAAIVGALAIQVEASLSFLGLGVPPPAPSLGGLLFSSLGFVGNAPFYGIFAGAALVLLIGSFMVLSWAIERAWSGDKGRVRVTTVLRRVES